MISKQQPTIGFIGAGNMATAIICGLLQDNYPAEKIHASSPDAAQMQHYAKQHNIFTTTDNKLIAQRADLIIIAVKPAQVKTVITEIATDVKQKLILSVATGIKTTSIAQWLGNEVAVIRCMPNTPALVGSGASALFASSHVSAEQKNLAEKIMRAVGITVWVDQETELDTVTALSGSGPAYFFLVMEALIDAAVELGLDDKTAQLLTLQTALGAAHLALETKETMANLRKKVTSKGGTTEAALAVLEKHQLIKIFKQAVNAAKLRAEQLAIT